LDVKTPVSGRSSPAFDCHAPWAGMLGATRRRHAGVQVCQPSQTGLLVPCGLMHAWHHAATAAPSREALERAGCWSPASGRRQGRQTSPPSGPGTTAVHARRWPSQRWRRHGRQRGVTVGPVPTPASLCAGAPGSTACGPASARPGGPATPWPPVASGAWCARGAGRRPGAPQGITSAGS
jgi:hypothetical protein